MGFSKATSMGEELMLQIKSWVAPPVFPNDEDKTRRANVLNLALINVLVLIPVLTIANILGGKVPTSMNVLNTLVFILCLIFVYWLRRGRIELASFGLMALGFIGITVAIANLGTIRVPTTAMYLLMVITAGLLFELRGMIAATVISSLLVAGLMVAQNMGLLPPPNYSITITQWISYTAIFGWAGSLTFSSLQSMNNALAKSNKELAERRRAEGELAKHRDHLEELVREGTAELEAKNAELSEDIAKRKHAQEELIKSENKYRTIFENTGTATVIVEDNTIISLTNSEFERLAGYSRDEIEGKISWTDFVVKEDLERMLEQHKLRRISSGTALGDYEFRFKDRDSNIKNILLNIDIIPGTKKSVASLLDITESKRAEKILKSNIEDLENSRKSIRQSQSLLMSIISSPKEIVIFALDREYRYLIFNQNHEDTMKVIWGVDIEIGHSMLEYIKNPEDCNKAKLNFDRALRGETYIVDEVYGDIALQRRYYEDHYSPIWENGDSVIGLTVFLTDITERKRAEEALQESENKYRAIFGNTGTATVIVEDNTKISLANSEFERLSGYSREEIEGKISWTEFIVKDDLERMMQLHNLRRIDPDAALKSYEFRARDRSGNIKNILLHIDMIPGTKKSVASWTDITEIKQTEEEMRSSNQLLDGIINTIPVRVFWKNRNLVYLGCNTIFAKDAGFADPKDIVGKDDYQMGWRDQAELYRADDRLVIESGLPKLLIEEPQTTPDGNLITLLTSKIPLRNSEGKIIGVLGTYMDITELKRAEQTLAEQAFMLAHISDAVIGTDADYRINYWSQSAERMYGYSQEEILGQYSGILKPEFLGMTGNKALEQLETTGSLKVELIHTTKEGRKIVIDSSNQLLYNEKGKPYGMIGINRDITERKQAEEALRQSEEKLAGLYASMVEGVGLHEIIYENGETPVDYIITDVNPSFEKIIGISRDKALGQRASALYGTNNAPFLDIYARVASSGKPDLFETYFEPLGKHFSISVFSLGKGKFATIFSDITERKRAENELKWNAALLEAQVEASLDGILVVNENGKRIITNERLLNMWSVPDEIRNEIDDAPLLDYAVGKTRNPDQFLEKVQYLYDHHDETSRDMIEFKDGMVFDRYSSPVLGRDGSYYGRIWTFRDITDSKLAEDRIMASLKEKEVLLKEVHHRVKNNLQIISALLSLQSSYITDEDILKIFRDSQNRIKSMALVHENLYRSKDLSKVDFNEYINQLVSNLSQSYGDFAGKINFKVNSENIYLNINTAIPCGMIINELVSNSFKHAFPEGRSGEICIDLSSEDDGFRLVVSDNGVGIKGDLNIKESETLGFRLIDTLVKQIDGIMGLDTTKGFRCEIHFKGLK